jgi:hypothetical protein
MKLVVRYSSYQGDEGVFIIQSSLADGLRNPHQKPISTSGSLKATASENSLLTLVIGLSTANGNDIFTGGSLNTTASGNHFYCRFYIRTANTNE